MDNKYGFLKPEIKPDDYVLGAGKIPEEVLQENGNWLLLLPIFEKQKKGTETYNCTAFGTTSALEILMKKKFGEEKNYSDRALGIMAGTFPPGNDPNTVAQALRDNGLINEELLPFSDDIDSVEKYYSPKPLPDNLVEAAKEFTNTYDFKHEWGWSWGVSLEEKHRRLKEMLKCSPIGVSVYAWEQDGNGLHIKTGEDNHWCVLYGFDELLNVWLIFDSYENNLKMLHPDYDFGWAKRYWIEKKPIVMEKKRPWTRFIEAIKRYFTEIFK